MRFLVNDLSMAGQFRNMESFRNAVRQMMGIRQHIRQHGYSLSCSHSLLSTHVDADVGMQQAVNHWLPIDARRAWMRWLTGGPCWEDKRHHDANEYLEADHNIVTDSAIGEAAVCCCKGLKREMVSFEPSTWLRSPILVKWLHDDQSADDIHVTNHWKPSTVQQSLANNPKSVASWDDVATYSIQRCTHLKFSTDAFVPLNGHPFSSGAADRIRELLNTLNQMKVCFNNDGSRNAEGTRLYQDHFTGDKAWFSDSSATEKSSFKKEFTFRHPDDIHSTIFCPWHGKVKTPQYRIHFSWPIVADTPLYIVYVGPKITKQ